MKKFISMVTMIMMLGLLMAGCGNSASNDGQQLKGNIATNGSTSMEKVIGILSEAFMQENSGVTITYDASGSGTGIEAVSKGT